MLASFVVLVTTLLGCCPAVSSAGNSGLSFKLRPIYGQMFLVARKLSLAKVGFSIATSY